MTFIQGALLKNLYNRSSLRNSSAGVRFSVKNRLSPASLKRTQRVSLNGEAIHPDRIEVTVDAGDAFPVSQIGPNKPMDFPLGTLQTFYLAVESLAEGKHGLALAFETEPSAG